MQNDNYEYQLSLRRRESKESCVPRTGLGTLEEKESAAFVAASVLGIKKRVKALKVTKDNVRLHSEVVTVTRRGREFRQIH